MTSSKYQIPLKPSGVLFRKGLLGLLLPILTLLPSYSLADDTDILFTSCEAEVPRVETTVEIFPGSHPDILFVMDNSTSMAAASTFMPYPEGEMVTATRLDALKASINFLLDTSKGRVGFLTLTHADMPKVGSEEILGLSSEYQESGSIPYGPPFENATAPVTLNQTLFRPVANNSGALRTDLEQLGYRSGSPHVQSLLEGALYFAGQPFGPGPRQGETVGAPAGGGNNNLVMILMTDGGANAAVSDIADVKRFLGKADGEEFQCNAKLINSEGNERDPNGSERCGVEVVSHLANTYNVRTHTVAFGGSNVDFLYGIALAGGGNYYQAADAQELLEAFTSILANEIVDLPPKIETVQIVKDIDIVSKSGANVISALPISNNSELYYNLVKPSNSAFWQGNLKKYAFNTDGTISGFNGVAIDENGEFIPTSQSLWSSAPDGDDISKGGLAEKLLAGNHPLLTNVNGALVPLSSDNSSLTAEEIDWAKRTAFDSLNTVPTVINYFPQERLQQLSLAPLYALLSAFGANTDPDELQTAVITANNGGFVNLQNAYYKSGQVMFSFLPNDEDIFNNLKTMYEAVQTEEEAPLFRTPKLYGMDGPISAWLYDDDKDYVYQSEKDRMELYLAMGRGGRSIYALDVKDPDGPDFLWRLEGGSGNFDRLGQTFSRVVKTKVVLDNEPRDILIFAGGYDTNRDTLSSPFTDDTMGNDIFVMDITDEGEPKLLWVASRNLDQKDKMNYSIPADIRAIDINSDGYVDQFYAADTGGQIWRFDIKFNHQGLAKDFIQGGVIADLAGPDSEQRHFFSQPDLSIIGGSDTQRLALSIGSGYRSGPLDLTIDDRFYVLFINDYRSTPEEYEVITNSDLLDASGGPLSDSQLASQNANNGWFINLEDTGEKSLTKSITLDGIIYFTTWTPGVVNLDAPCEAVQGTGRLYAIRIINAEGELPGSEGQRSESYASDTIPAEPQIFKATKLWEDGRLTEDYVCVGTTCKKLGKGSGFESSFWRTLK